MPTTISTPADPKGEASAPLRPEDSLPSTGSIDPPGACTAWACSGATELRTETNGPVLGASAAEDGALLGERLAYQGMVMTLVRIGTIISAAHAAAAR